MTAIEVIALILIVISVIKLIVIAVNPKAWYGPANPLVKAFSNNASAIVFSLVIGAVVLFYLLTELSIVQIFAATAFAFAFLMLMLAPYMKEIMETVVGDAETGKHFLTKHWLSIVIWIVLIVWVVWEIFVL